MGANIFCDARVIDKIKEVMIATDKAEKATAEIEAVEAKIVAEITTKEAEIKEQIAALCNELKAFKATKMAEYKATKMAEYKTALTEIKERRINEAKEAATEEETSISTTGAEKREAKKAIKAALKIKISGIQAACKPMGITKLLAKYVATNSNEE